MKKDINYYIPSFGKFMLEYLPESDIETKKGLEITFEFLNNPKKYNSVKIIKEYLNNVLEINQYIQLINKMELND